MDKTKRDKIKSNNLKKFYSYLKNRFFSSDSEKGAEAWVLFRAFKQVYVKIPGKIVSSEERCAIISENNMLRKRSFQLLSALPVFSVLPPIPVRGIVCSYTRNWGGTEIPGKGSIRTVATKELKLSEKKGKHGFRFWCFSGKEVAVTFLNIHETVNVVEQDGRWSYDVGRLRKRLQCFAELDSLPFYQKRKTLLNAVKMVDDGKYDIRGRNGKYMICESVTGRPAWYIETSKA